MFRSAEHALNWAYNTAARPIVNLSGINHMNENSRPCLPNSLLVGLSVQDLHKQADNIIGMAAKLTDPAGREYIAAYFGHRVGRDDTRILVYRACAASGLELKNAGAVYQIVRDYFGGRAGYRSVRKLLGCRDQYAIMIKNAIYDTLDVIFDRAMAEMREMLESRGLIRSSACA